jgi:hypothetical protein
MAEFEQYYLGKTQSLDDKVVDSDFVSSPNVVYTAKNLIVKDFFSVAGDEVKNTKGHRIGLTNCSSVETLTISDFFAVVPSVSVAPTITLPRAQTAGIGKVYIIKDISGSASATTITISPQSGETINGDTSTSINTNYGFVGLFTNGVNWFTS